MRTLLLMPLCIVLSPGQAQTTRFFLDMRGVSWHFTALFLALTSREVVCFIHVCSLVLLFAARRPPCLLS